MKYYQQIDRRMRTAEGSLQKKLIYIKGKGGTSITVLESKSLFTGNCWHWTGSSVFLSL